MWPEVVPDNLTVVAHGTLDGEGEELLFVFSCVTAPRRETPRNRWTLHQPTLQISVINRLLYGRSMLLLFVEENSSENCP